MSRLRAVGRRVRGWTRTRSAELPLRTKLLAIMLGLLVAAVGLTGWGSQEVLRHNLIGQVDEQLASSGRPLAADSSRLLRLFTSQGVVRADGTLPSTFVLQVTGDVDPTRPGTLLPSDLSGSGYPMMRTFASTSLPPTGVYYTADSADGATRWRVAAYPIADAGGVLSIALPLTSVERAVTTLRLITLLFTLAAALLSATFGYLAIRRSFRPLREVEETAAAIAAGDLSRRIPDRPPSTEVGRLTRSLNGMLTQIESAFNAQEASEQRTRRFAADASHELRTPLASIRGFAELYRQGAVPEAEVPRVLARIEEEARRMGGLVEDLLTLARLDEQRPSRAEEVDLAVLAADAVHDARGLAPDRTVRLVGLAPGAGPQPVLVVGDESRLRQVVANLVGNAVRHTPTGSPIELAIGHQDGAGVLQVRDHGPGLTQEQAERVFERFVRLDASRQRGTGGSGLGLSIVAAVVSAHAGGVQVLSTPGGGATFQVTLPLEPAAEDAAARSPRAVGERPRTVSVDAHRA